MARQRPKQLEPNRIGPSKLGFDGGGVEEDGWVFVKKQRVIIVLPSLPLPEPSFTVEKPPAASSHSQPELRDSVFTTDTHVVVPPSLPPPEQFVSQKKPETCQSLVELRDVIAADIRKTAPAYATASSLPRPEDFMFRTPVTSQSQAAELRENLREKTTLVLQKPATSQLQANLRDGIADMQATPETSQTQSEFRAGKHEASLVHIMVPSLPVIDGHITSQKPSTSKAQADIRGLEMHKSTLVQPVVPSLPVTEHTPLHNPATLQSQAELRAKETRKAALAYTMVPSRPVSEHITLQKPVTSQSKAELRAKETLKATRVAPSLPVLEHCTSQKPSAWQSQAGLRAEETRKATLANTVVSSLPAISQKPATSQSKAGLRAKETPKATLVQAVMPSLPVLDYCNLQKPGTSQSQAELRAKETTRATLVQAEKPATHHHRQAEPRDFASDAQETADFQAVDKPERVIDRSYTTRKAPPPGPRRSLQDRTTDPDRRLAIHRSRRAGHIKPVRFPRVMCSSVVMDNEKLRVVNLEKKVERAGGLNEWVGSIGLGREFERMLRGQRMSKFQMANLTMEKLKQMGALAVGPRRKLIHAIRCVYHPHCLRASFH